MPKFVGSCLFALIAGSAFAQQVRPLGVLIAETEHELRTGGVRRFEKIGELIDAGTATPEAERELAAYMRQAPDEVLVHYLPFAIDLGLATVDTYGTLLAELMSHDDLALRDRAFETATHSGSLTNASERNVMIDAMNTHLTLEQNDERLIRSLRELNRCDERFAGLEERLLDIRLNHPNPRVVSGAANALYAIRGGGDPSGSLTKTLRAYGLDAGDRVRKLCEQMLYK